MDNRRKTIVINKRFQYQYSLLVVALAVILVNGFLIVRLIAPGEDALALSTGAAALLGAVELILIGSIWYVCLRASHRIAGPVYVFNREIGKIGAGDLTASIRLRDRDMFRDEAQQMNDSLATLRAKIASAQALARQLKEAQVSGGDIAGLAEQLDNELSSFTTD